MNLRIATLKVNVMDKLDFGLGSACLQLSSAHYLFCTNPSLSLSRSFGRSCLLRTRPTPISSCFVTFQSDSILHTCLAEIMRVEKIINYNPQVWYFID